MKILLLIKRFDFGGAENHVCDLANSLIKSGHEVWVISRKGRQIFRLHPQIRFIEFRFSYLLQKFHAQNIRTFVIRNKIEIVHAHQRLPIRIACLCHFSGDVKIIATVHGKVRHDLSSRFVRNKTDKIICVSKTVFFFALKYPEICHKTFYIPNGLVFFSSEQKTSYAGRNIFYISRLDNPHYRLISMIINIVLPKLMVYFPDVTFTIVGDGIKLKTIQKEAEKTNSKLGSLAIKTTGYLSAENALLYKASLILGAGRVAMEAVAKNIPVLLINPNHTGPLLISENYKYFSEKNFVAVNYPPPDSDLIFSAISDFFKSVTVNQHEFQLLKKWVARDFDMEVITRQIADLYNASI
jgi:glycosyltransferase involved in cell wall biosynthesis